MRWSSSFMKWVGTLFLPFMLLAPECDFPTGGQETSLISIDRNWLTYGEPLTVTFRNVLDRNIAVLTSGCGLEGGGYLPELVIEKQISEGWERAGAPICIAIATPEIPLEPGESEQVTFSVATGLNDSAITGRFRYVFDIRAEKNGKYPAESRLSKEFRTSPPFTINKSN